MVDVAQLVEHQIVALVVVGSIPTIHPSLRRPLILSLSKDGWHANFFKGLTLKYQ